MTDAQLDEALARLSPLAPEPRRTSETRRRGLVMVRRRTARRARVADARAAVLRTVAPVVVGVLCILYVVVLFSTTWQLTWQGLP